MIVKDQLGPVIDEKGYEFVIVDCPPNLNLVTQNTLMLSDSYVVVCLPEYLSVRGLGIIQNQIEKMVSQINLNLARFGATETAGPMLRGIIFNKIEYVTGGTIAQENWKRQVEQQYGGIVFEHFVAETVKIAEASYRGPITLSPRTSDDVYVQQLSDVAEEFFDKVVHD